MTEVEPKTAIAHQCFWCAVPLTRDNRSKDHMLSRPIRPLNKTNVKNDVRLCCRKCNTDRCSITNLYVRATDKRITGQPRSKARLNKLRKNLSFCLPLMLSFEQKVKEKLSGELQRLCLLEVQTCLKFEESFRLVKMTPGVTRHGSLMKSLKQNIKLVSESDMPRWKKWTVLALLKLARYVSKGQCK